MCSIFFFQKYSRFSFDFETREYVGWSPTSDYFFHFLPCMFFSHSFYKTTLTLSFLQISKMQIRIKIFKNFQKERDGKNSKICKIRLNRIKFRIFFLQNHGMTRNLQNLSLKQNCKIGEITNCEIMKCWDPLQSVWIIS